jgi:hypothetical protein
MLPPRAPPATEPTLSANPISDRDLPRAAAVDAVVQVVEAQVAEVQGVELPEAEPARAVLISRANRLVPATIIPCRLPRC